MIEKIQKNKTPKKKRKTVKQKLCDNGSKIPSDSLAMT